MSLLPLGLLSQGGGAGGATGGLELISTTVATGSSSTITFSSVPATYAHLQLRIVAASSSAVGYNLVRVNGATSGYKSHTLYGFYGDTTAYSSAPAAGTASFVGGLQDVPIATDAFGVAIVDILDYAKTTKNKTFRSLSGSYVGFSSTSSVNINSGVYLSTTAVTSVSVTHSAATNYLNGSRFSLYGIKG